MRRFVVCILFISLLQISRAEERIIPYTQSDRDRMVRVETRIESMEAQINRIEVKFDSYFMWGFGLVLMSIFGLIGFIIDDRRTTLAPLEH